MKVQHTGATLRDLAAISAISGKAWDAHSGHDNEIAKRAYLLADAMLRARLTTTEEGRSHE